MSSDRDRGAHRGTARHRRRRIGAAGGPRDRGSATAELAAAFPVVVLLLLAGLTGLAALSAKVRCSDAAGVAARAAARGEPASAAASQTAPSGATISVHRDGGLVRATVRFRVRPMALLPAFTVEEDAVAMVEPEAEGP
ncbi:TadE family type IV pilus minor pilin [Dactylosporangium roseum]|uniref:TadE family type IV pilus minor pilin n=1 Tax=Dactylosporangium roseum TaxID=47989 RepID=UPI0021B26F1E|nr:TadE family type IV pilus minor pilin [Dactylosporangium roseum]